jgi:hypothetical protein
MRRLIYLLCAILLALSASSTLAWAQTPQPPAPPQESSVWITRINPPIAVTLTPGTNVRFVIDAEYTLTVAEGSVVLYIQGAAIHIATEVKEVTRGSGTVSFDVTVNIPRTRRVDVITALYTGNAPTRITDSRVFEVARVPQN